MLRLASQVPHRSSAWREGAAVIKPDFLRDIAVIAEDKGENEPPFVQIRRSRLRYVLVLCPISVHSVVRIMP